MPLSGWETGRHTGVKIGVAGWETCRHTLTIRPIGVIRRVLSLCGLVAPHVFPRFGSDGVVDLGQRKSTVL